MTQNLNVEQGEVDLAFAVAVVWMHRYRIAAIAFAATVVAVIAVLFISPVYKAEAVLAAKEPSRSGGNSNLLSSFGGLGGMVASQLGLSGSTLERIEVVARSHELIGRVIEENHLLPVLFPSQWDAENRRWKSSDSTRIPSIRKGIERFRKQFLSVSKNTKSNTLTLMIYSNDPRMAESIANSFLTALNFKLRESVARESDLNRQYLESQLVLATDPVLRDKIVGLMASELEKAMLMNSQTFDVLDKPALPLYPIRPKRKMIVIIVFCLGIFFGAFGFITWELSGAFRESLRRRLMLNAS